MSGGNTQPGFALGSRGRRAVDQPISYLMQQAIANPRVISLAAGLVDYDSLPGEDVAKLIRAILSEPASARAALQYGTTEGFAELRTTLYEHMAGLDGVDAAAYPGSPEQVVVTSGSQQLLHILTDLLVDPGDIVITAWPSYFVYTGALSALGAVVRAIDIDEHGMIPDRLDRLLSGLEKAGQLRRVKVLYCCSYHQNPTGLTLGADRRPAILDIVRRYSEKAGQRILLIEDAAYRELTYRGKAPPSIKKWDTDNRYVALLQTFSKPFAPGLKTGYGLLPAELIEPVLFEKGGRDFGSNNLSQHVLNEAMRRGVYARHVERLCKVYAEKLQTTLDALDEHMSDLLPEPITWTKPTGGLYVWLTLPATIDTSRGGKLFEMKLREGVLVVPGVYCYPPDPTRTPPRNAMRLSFGTPTLRQTGEGVARLASAIRRVAEASYSTAGQ